MGELNEQTVLQTLIRSLREVPKGQGHSIPGNGFRTVIPYGNMMHDAADKLETFLALLDAKDAAIAEAVAWADKAYANSTIRDILAPFLPAKPDPLVAAYVEHTDSFLTTEEAEVYVSALRAAIERAGGTISFEGEG